MTNSAVVTSINGNVGLICINRAEKFNCLSEVVHQQLQAALQKHEGNTAVRAILLCSEGKHFCTGADLDEVNAKIASNDEEVIRRFIQLGHDTCNAFERSSLPVVGAIQGFCLAGGLELSLSCDVLFSADDAVFGDQHANYGLIPGWGGSQRLPRTVGFRRALDLMMSGRRLKAQEAFDWGMVNYLAPSAELRQQAIDYCQTIASKSADGIAMMKALAYSGVNLTLDDALELEVNEAVKGLQSDDVKEGLAAFAGRREPAFKSR